MPAQAIVELNSDSQSAHEACDTNLGTYTTVRSLLDYLDNLSS